MTKKINLFFPLLAIALLAGCSKSLDLTTLSGEWYVAQINGETVSNLAKAPYFGIENGRLNGNTGCNSFSADLPQKGAHLDFSKMVTTLRYCPDNETEQKLYAALRSCKQSKGNAEAFVLTDERGGELVVCLKRTIVGDLLDGKWYAQVIDGQAVPQSESETPFIGFDAKKGSIYGFTGCNRLTGSFNLKDLQAGKADFSALGSTRMLCQDAKWERPFLDALAKTRHLRLAGNYIFMNDENGKQLMKLSKKE